MRKMVLSGLVLIVLGCERKVISKEDLRYLNGYWEIQTVEFSDGTQKKYGINPTIDFIQLKGLTGFRKKLQPKFDGSYQTSNNLETFTVVPVNESFVLRYKTELSEREETLLHLDTISFTVRNNDGVTYAYKRFQPIVIPK